MRLATFNLLHGRSVPDLVCDAPRLEQAAAGLDADVVGLQEVDRHQERSDRRDLTVEVAAALGADHHRFAAAVVGTPGEAWRAATVADRTTEREPHYGVALVSRLPVLSWHEVELPAAPVRSPVLLPGTRRVVWLRDEPRLGLAAVVEGPEGPFTVATTHLSFVPGWNGVQLRTLTAALRRFPGPRVLLGDLNMPGRLPGLLTGWQPLARTATYPTWRPRVQLDHVLGDGRLPPVTRVETPALPVSDHRALVVTLAAAPGR